jgi:hypothetical protein
LSPSSLEEGDPGKKCACGSGTPASDAPAGRGHPQVVSFGAGMPASDASAERGIPPVIFLRGRDARRRIFPLGHPPPRRRATKKRCWQTIPVHMIHFTYEDIKIKNKYVVGIPRTFYLSTEISRSLQSRETIPLIQLGSFMCRLKL